MLADPPEESDCYNLVVGRRIRMPVVEFECPFEIVSAFNFDL